MVSKYQRRREAAGLVFNIISPFGAFMKTIDPAKWSIDEEMDYQCIRLKQLTHLRQAGKETSNMKRELHSIRWYVLVQLEAKIGGGGLSHPNLQPLPAGTDRLLTSSAYRAQDDPLILATVKSELLIWLRERCDTETISDEDCRWLLTSAAQDLSKPEAPFPPQCGAKMLLVSQSHKKGREHLKISQLKGSHHHHENSMQEEPQPESEVSEANSVGQNLGREKQRSEQAERSRARSPNSKEPPELEDRDETAKSLFENIEVLRLELQHGCKEHHITGTMKAIAPILCTSAPWKQLEASAQDELAKFGAAIIVLMISRLVAAV